MSNRSGPAVWRALRQERLLDNITALHEFLGSERFGKTLPEATAIDALNLPLNNEKRHRAANQFASRLIANAMAGVPDLSWRKVHRMASAWPWQWRAAREPWTSGFWTYSAARKHV